MRNISSFQFFIIVFAGLLGEMASDIYIPALPTIAEVFNVSYSDTGLTITINLIGFSLSCIIFGTASDYKGRRISVLTGVFIFCVSSFLCAFANSLTELIILRFMQGFGAGSTNSIGMAVINDTCSGNDRLKMMSTFGAVTSISPAVAPIIASMLALVNNGWRISFIIVGILTLLTFLGILFKLPETASNTAISKKIDFLMVRDSFFRAMKIRNFIVFTSMQCLLFVSIWVFIAEFPYIFGTVLGFPMKYYGYAVSLDIALYVFGAYLNQKLIDTNGPEKNLIFGLAFNTIVGFVAFILLFFGKQTLLLANVIFFISHIGVAFVLSNNVAIATHGNKDISGMLSSFIVSLSLSAGAIGIWVFGLISSIDPMKLFVLVAVLTSFLQIVIFFLFASRSNEVSINKAEKSHENLL